MNELDKFQDDLDDLAKRYYKMLLELCDKLDKLTKSKSGSLGQVLSKQFEDKKYKYN